MISCCKLGIRTFTGRLEAPLNFSVDIRGNLLLLSWEEPFVLRGVPAPTYIINTTVNSTVLWETNKTSALKFSKATVDNSSCTLYELCVQASTAAGLGETACLNKSRIGGTYNDN